MAERPQFKVFYKFSNNKKIRIFGLGGNSLGTKRATGDPLVEKPPDFPGLFIYYKKIDFVFWISGFLVFWILETKRAAGVPLEAKQQEFQGLFRFSKKVWISGLNLWHLNIVLMLD